MEANEILLKVKEFFNELVNPTPVQNEVMPIEVETKDGVKITVDKLEVGGVAMVDGVPAPIGEHTLTDGTIIMVTDNGVIAEIKPKVEEVAPVEVETPDIDMAAKFAVYEKFGVGTAEERLANLEIITKAIFNNVFGWQLREAQEKNMLETAKTVYAQLSKQDMPDNIKEKFEQYQLNIERQNKVISELIKLNEELAKQPVSEPDQVIVDKSKFSATALFSKRK